MYFFLGVVSIKCIVESRANFIELQEKVFPFLFLCFYQILMPQLFEVEILNGQSALTASDGFSQISQVSALEHRFWRRLATNLRKSLYLDRS